MKYEIKGKPFPVAVCYLDEGEAVITEGGGMSWMTPNIQMETTSNGGAKKVFERMLSKEKLFQNRYTCISGRGMISFASSFPGEIKVLDIKPGEEYVCQKSSFLASTTGVNMSIYFQKKFGAGLFGGEGFVMQKFDGEGLVFVEIDGSVLEYDLQEGEQLILDTGHLVMMSATCKMDIQSVKGMKNLFLGGEGMFNTVVQGPGKVFIQTIPVNKLADTLVPYIPASSNSSKSSGSIGIDTVKNFI